MIIILGYNNSENRLLNDILSENHSIYKYSLLENDIIKANKIILPHPSNFNFAYRRMNIMNLFSVLRMIQTPVLGINDGFRLMCSQLTNKYKQGLGFFDFDVACPETERTDKNLIKGEVIISDKLSLLDSSFDHADFVFNPETQPPLNEFTSVKISYKDLEYTMLFRNNNYFALSAYTKLNEEITRNLISNFIML